MPTAPTDIVSLSRIKRELRLPVDDTADDATLTEQLTDAVSYVSAIVDAPLLDKIEVFYTPAPGAASIFPIRFRRHAVRAVTGIRYWTTDGELRLDPDGVIAQTSLGRFSQSSRRDSCNEIYPPSDGWLGALDDTCYEVSIRRSLIDDTNRADTAPLERAVILVVREFFNGYREIKPTDAFFSQVEPFRWLG